MLIWSDVRLAVRLLRRAPGVTSVAVLSLALGVGAVATVFAAVEAVLIKPLPYVGPDELVIFRADYRNVRESEGDWVSRLEAEEILRRSRTMENAGVWANEVFDLEGDGSTAPEALFGLRATASLLPTLGTPPMLGRFFDKSEELDTATQMILSYGLWIRRFHGDRNVLGQNVTINGHACRIIGVMGPEFNFPYRRVAARTPQPYVEFWTPMSLEKQNAEGALRMVARLKPGATLASAQQDVAEIGEALAREFPESNRDRILRISRLRDSTIGQAGRALWLLMAAACLFVLIGCANVANLLLARGLGRQREMAVRVALGASRGHIIRQLLTEGCVLAVMGGAVACAVTAGAWRILPAVAPRTIPRLATAHVDWRVAAFALATSFASGLLFALAPALRSSRAGELGARGAATGRHDWLRGGLIAAEVAITVTLVVTAGRLLGTFIMLLNTDPGFTQNRVLAAVILPQPERYHEPAARALVYRRFLVAARALPGVVSAGTVDALPFSGENNGGFITTRPEDIANRRWETVVEVDTVGGDYLATMGAKLEDGRWFHGDEGDTAIISDVAARRLWPGESALGRRVCVFCSPEQPDNWKRVVGVVSSMRHLGLDGDVGGSLYLAADAMKRAQFLVIRTERPANEYEQVLRRAIASVDPHQPVLLSASMEALVEDSLAAQRFLMLLLAVMGGLALVMSVAGIYGVTAFTTSRRTQEIGIRMALGATPRRVHEMVFRDSIASVVGGLLIGAIATAAVERTLQAALPGATGGWVGSIWIASGVVMATSILACWMPARRATRVDPMSALRAE